MELNILESGKIGRQFMEMGSCNRIPRNTLGSLWTASSTSMEDKSKNIKFIKDSLRVDAGKDMEPNILNNLWNRGLLMSI